MKIYHKFLLYQNKLLKPYIRIILGLVEALTYLASLTLIVGVIYEHGFPLSVDEIAKIQVLYKAVWIIFLIDVTLHISLEYRSTKKQYRKLAWILSGLLYLTLIPVIFHRPEEEGAILQFWEFLDGKFYHLILLLVFSLLNLSNGLVRLLGRRTNPSLILAVSFLAIILIGTGLLMLPKCTVNGITWVDSLFTATSAVCVTGLVPVDVSTTFTTGGLVVIILLIQIGGLGVMTLTSFFAMFFMGNTSLYNQLVVRDMVSSNSLGSLLSTLLYILGFTLAIEGVGMVVIWLSVHGMLGMTLQEELFFSAFHSVSAFCNAGFSTLPGGMGNPAVMQGHNLLYITLGLLIALGGIGFPILVNLYETVAYYLQAGKFWLLRRSGRFRKKVHLYNLNTKIVLVATVFLLIGGTLLIAALEWNHSFAGMPVADKWVHAFFNSSCPRTAGFASVGLTSLSTQTLLLMVVLMMIGGGTQSTAGGVKVNVFAVVLINLWAVVRGADRVAILRRELSHDSIRRSNAALILYLFMVFLAIFLLSVLEPEAGLLAITFECVSALSTVGSSLDLTPTLGSSSKLLVILLMYIGRVGAFTLLTGLVRQEKKRNYRYPSDNIIIN